MELIVINNRLGRSHHVHLDPKSPWLITALAGVLVLFIGAGVGIGRLTADTTPAHAELPGDLTSEWQAAIDASRADVEAARRSLDENTQALARKVAMLQAEMMRLNAAGQRLVEVADLDEGEFAFDAPVAVGGPDARTVGEAGEVGEAPSLVEVSAVLDELDQRIGTRAREIRVLEDLIQASRIHAESYPEGRPIVSGWVSSLFGLRTDPFTGRKASHYGMDFAGREGSEIVSVASGVVTWSGNRHGYGNLVEVNHGNGFVTRYGHNKANLVEVGQRVEKGQAVALMGNTGRSTGPHVHFEVRRDGKVVDPARYISAQR